MRVGQKTRRTLLNPGTADVLLINIAQVVNSFRGSSVIGIVGRRNIRLKIKYTNCSDARTQRLVNDQSGGPLMRCSCLCLSWRRQTCSRSWQVVTACPHHFTPTYRTKQYRRRPRPRERNFNFTSAPDQDLNYRYQEFITCKPNGSRVQPLRASKEASHECYEECRRHHLTAITS